jgi:hypothetical protein
MTSHPLPSPLNNHRKSDNILLKIGESEIRADFTQVLGFESACDNLEQQTSCNPSSSSPTQQGRYHPHHLSPTHHISIGVRGTIACPWIYL